MTGFINLYKPQGMSSALAVNIVKKKFNSPCGHMGTLDPLAEGVLPIAVGKATRLFQYTLEKQKTYIAEFTFGAITDTLDRAGIVEKTCEKIPTESEIMNALPTLVGKIMQVPPKYSAKNIAGKRGYELARKGVEFSLPAKEVNILSFELLGKVSEKTFKFKIECEGGTYIRSLARDLGEKVGSLAFMSSLIRSKSGIFEIENSITIEQLKSCEKIESLLTPSDSVVSFEKLVLTNETATKILNGVYEDIGVLDGTYRVYNGEEFWGVGVAEKGKLKIKSYVR